MRKQIVALFISTFVLLSGCMLDPRQENQAVTVALDCNLAAVFSQTLGGGLTRAAGTFTGTLAVDDPATGTSPDYQFPWYADIDEAMYTAASNKTIVLAPGSYTFSLQLSCGSHTYAGQSPVVVLADGEQPVPLILSPVLGQTQVSVSLSQVPRLKFQYPALELAALTEPRLGYSIDGGPEVILLVNKATGLSAEYLNLTTGSHTIRLKLFDGNIQIGKSVAAQEAVNVALTNELRMDLVPLYSEVAFTPGLTGGTAGFDFLVPAEIVAEAGGPGNLAALFQLSGSVNGARSAVLTLVQEAGGYTAHAELENLHYETVALALSFKDVAQDEIIASAAAGDVNLDANTRTITLATELIRRAVVRGRLLAVLGVNVLDAAGTAVEGAAVYANNVFAGLSGSGSFGTAGYLKLYLEQGSHTIRADRLDRTGQAQVTLSPLEIENTDVRLDTERQLRLTEVQSIPTIGAIDWEYFTIGTEHYAAVANWINGNNTYQNSVIYRWDGNQFIPIQAIPTIGAMDIQYMLIGNDHFLAIANYRTGPTITGKLNLILYKWDGASFIQFQAIPTNAGVTCEGFIINNDMYFAVSNTYDESHQNTYSKIYKWNGNQFVEFQSILTHSATDWEFFKLGTNNYLVVANALNNSTYNIDSYIYKWDGTQFVEFQSIPTNGAYDWEFFTLESNYYLAAANYYNNFTYNIHSKIYKWDGSRFADFQGIATNGGLDWKAFSYATSHFLAIANYRNDSTFNVNSKIYKWNGLQFEHILDVPTNGAADWDYFEIDANSYLLLANCTNGTTNTINSKLYRLSYE